MYPLSKRIRVAVIGSPSSGKSYLIYDLIHAFSLLGYKAKELPLSYPHSSFGAYFYDVFNNQTGGMRGTEPYFCRPENHYGAYLTLGKPFRLPYMLKVDFLNIPGETFKLKSPDGTDISEVTIRLFFELKSAIEQCREDYFCLSKWKSPAGHVRNLVTPKGRRTPIKAKDGKVISLEDRHVRHLEWDELENELGAGEYKLKRVRNISGQDLLKHLSELDIDSVIKSIKDVWEKLPVSISKSDIHKYDTVFHYFYPLVYCQNATDIILCDRLTQDTSGGRLSKKVLDFIIQSGSRHPHVYMAFREADVLLKGMTIGKGSDVRTRDNSYANFLEWILTLSKDCKRATLKETLETDKRERIEKCLGQDGESSFWSLLRGASYVNAKLPHLTGNALPPHVWFTATPIDSEGKIYANDSNDITRFIHEGEKKKAFVREVREDMSRHYCFGTLQLLIDILLQNGIGIDRQTEESLSKSIKYFLGKTI